MQPFSRGLQGKCTYRNEASPWWLASPQFQGKVADSAPLRHPPLVGSKTGLDGRSSGFTNFLKKSYKILVWHSSAASKDTFTAALCGGHTLDHAPESCLFVLVLPPLVHLPPSHCDSRQRRFRVKMCWSHRAEGRASCDAPFLLADNHVHRLQEASFQRQNISVCYISGESNEKIFFFFKIHKCIICLKSKV